MRSPTRLLGVLVGGVFLIAASTGAGGAKLHYWHGYSKDVQDGDTFRIDLVGDGAARWVQIRNAQIQAMETGECHAAAAKARLAGLVLPANRRIRLSSSSVAAMPDGRLGRFAEVWDGRRWVDVQQALLAEGRVLWMPSGPETAHAREYLAAAQDAGSKRIGMYDPDACGYGPAQGAQIGLSTLWSAASNDPASGGQDFVRLSNRGSAAVALGGWWLRQAHPLTYRPALVFPRGTVVPARGSIVVHAGRGTQNSPRGHYYLNYGSGLIQNVSRDSTVGWGGFYLFDPHGDVRAWSMYPCFAGCRPPQTGRLTIVDEAHHFAGAWRLGPGRYWFEVAPAPGVAAVDLGGLLATTSAATGRNPNFERELPPSLVLRSGQRLRIDFASGASGWKGSTYYLYVNQTWVPRDMSSTGWYALRDDALTFIACRSWGGASCPIVAR